MARSLSSVDLGVASVVSLDLLNYALTCGRRVFDIAQSGLNALGGTGVFLSDFTLGMESPPTVANRA